MYYLRKVYAFNSLALKDSLNNTAFQSKRGIEKIHLFKNYKR